MSDPRLFLSVPCSASLQARLLELQRQLRASTWELQLSDPADFHLALHFLGATPERVVDDLKRELGAVAHAHRPFDLACGGLSCFSDEDNPRVVYASLHDSAAKLMELFEATRRVLNAYRLFKLRDELTPHITLARVTKLSAAWDPMLLRGLAPQWDKLGTYPVERMQLMQSHLGREGGPRYELLADLRLGGQ